MKDMIYRQDAIAHLKKRLIETAINNVGVIARCDSIFGDTADNRIGPWLNELPSAQPDEEKISDILYNIYRNTSPHTSAEGVAAAKYYIREIYREIYGEEGPRWMKK